MSQSDPALATHDRKAGKPPSHSTSFAVLPGATYINKLPTELLRECFELATDRPAPLNSQSCGPSAAEVDFALRRQSCKSAWSIGLTCKRFSAIMAPILYSRIELIPPTWRDEPRTDHVSVRFIQTMNTVPATRELIESLSISTHHFSQIKTVPGLEKSDFKRLRTISLAVIHAWSKEEWNVCCTNLRNLPVLSGLHIDLRLRCESGFRPLYRLLEQLPRLSALTLGGVCGDDSSLEVFEWDGDHTDFGIDHALASQHTNGSAPFTQLHLLSFGHSDPAGLRHLLSLPSSLETLTLDTLGMCDYSLEGLVELGFLSFAWTFDHLKELLSPHRFTLQELRVRQHGPAQEGLDRFDLHAFESLHTLQLCTMCLPTPERACDLWLTSSLQRLAFESSRADGQRGIWWHFYDTDFDWLADFAKMANDRKVSGVSGLRIIEIICGTCDDKGPQTDSQRSDIEANRSKAKGVVEARGFEFVWRTEI